jgi:hypothetical protein
LADDAARNRERAGAEVACQAELERHLEHEDALERNLSKSCSLIWSTCCDCDEVVQSQLELKH